MQASICVVRNSHIWTEKYHKPFMKVGRPRKCAVTALQLESSLAWTTVLASSRLQYDDVQKAC